MESNQVRLDFIMEVAVKKSGLHYPEKADCEENHKEPSFTVQQRIDLVQQTLHALEEVWRRDGETIMFRIVKSESGRFADLE